MASRRELLGALGALLRRIAVTDRVEDLRSGGVYDNAVRLYGEGEKGNIAPVAWTPFRQVPHGNYSAAELADAMKATGYDEAEARAAFERIIAEESLWVNSIYQVNKRDLGDGGVHLSIKRIDQETVHDWRDLQRIKNELIGPDCEAIELYPAEDRRVDTANQYHLWGTADPAFRFSFGFDRRVTSVERGSHLQRPEDGL